MNYVTNGVIEWNQREYRRAMADVNNKNLHVPANAKKLDANGRFVPMTLDEYRDMRARDAARHSKNIAALQERE